MAIPKEPRQLMINLMYLVLTALLALNVSAEVMNAFFTLDNGNKESIATVESQLDQTERGLKDLLSDESKQKYRPIEPAVERIRSVVKDFNSYVNDLRDEIIDEAGNNDGQIDDEDYTMSYGKRVPKGKKNKDVTTRMLVDEGRGEELKKKIMETREAMVKTYTDLLEEHGKTFGLQDPEIKNRIDNIGNNLPFGVDDKSWKESKDKKSWADFKFRQMPVAAVLPLMSQMQSDAKSSEAALINNMAELAGGRVVEFDAFFPVVQAEKAYVIRGEPFKAEISVGTYSTQVNPDDIGIYVNDSKLPVNEQGRAEYTTSTSSLGTKTLNLRVEVRNPLTGEVTEGDGSYSYEVGERSVTVSAEKMNVFYIGVDNPVAVSAAGVSSNDLRVSISGGGGSIRKEGSANYMVTVSQQGECRVNVTGGGIRDSKLFRVKRIPDPVARLGNVDSGPIGNGTFKAQRGLVAWLDNFDFDAKCQIQGFELVYVAKRQDPVPAINSGGIFAGDAQRLIAKAKPGDYYYFDNVKARCPGDKAGRKINSLVFRIN